MVDDPGSNILNQIHSAGSARDNVSPTHTTANNRIADRRLLAWWWRIAPQDVAFKAIRVPLPLKAADAAPDYSPPYDDPASAYNATITALWRSGSHTPDEIDMAVSQVAYFALCGDRACAWLVWSVLRRCIRAKYKNEEAIELQQLADAWRRFATRPD
jgi:hypothetical protein